MNLANDYFLLYHGIQIQNTNSFEITKTKDNDDFFSICALLLSVTRSNFEKYLALSSFAELISQVSIQVPKNLQEFNQLQYALIVSIIKDIKQDDINMIHDSFEYLKNQEIIFIMDYDKLISLFDPSEIIPNDDEIEVSDELVVDDGISFQDNKRAIEDTILELKELIENEEFEFELDDVESYLNNQKFSIGITGVMNAGKSTMLNALMGQEILGSNVVPETANLTIVKYDKKPSASVVYWSKPEWDKIEQSAKEIESIKDFVLDTNKHFGDKLDNFIQESSKSEEIDIHNLSSYTSADKSDKKCNLVKYVELKTDLNFLSDGIEIVDTPGLDDPVIQREEITKEYIGGCDLMIHLMNVSQSATLKDVEFIIDALLYQNITKLLIVVTRADTVSKDQLSEVIEYTKSSIKNQLKAINKDSQIDYILKTIKFMPISGYMALLHRTGRSEEAISAGYHLEDTGILEVEDYLNEILFGTSSQKGKLILNSSKLQISKIIQKVSNILNYELRLLSKSEDELKEELEKFSKKKIEKEKNFITMKSDIEAYKRDAKDYIATLETFLSSELIDLKTIIKQRVVGDVKYSFEKDKKRPANSRIKSIIETAVKDGIIDIVRDYRYKFIKKSQSIGEICEQKYQKFGFMIGHKNDNFNAMGFFQNDFKTGFLTTSNDVFVSKIVTLVAKSKASKLGELDTRIEEVLKEEFINIEKNIVDKSKTISEELIEQFFKTLNAPLYSCEQEITMDENILQKQLTNIEQKGENDNGLSIEIHKKLKKLDNINKGCK